MQQDHAEEILHFDDLLRSFSNNFEIITEEFEQLIASSHDGTPGHNILWPRHGPDLAEQPSLHRLFTIPSSPQADDVLPTHALSTLPFLVSTSCYAIYTRRLFDPG
eukprot:462960-Ditylum_brightwellii.AAC.1